VRVIAGYELPWDIHDCIKVYQKYSLSRFKKGSLSLPALSESVVLCALANKSWVSGLGNIYNWLLESAIAELSGKHDIQTYLKSCKSKYTKIDIGKLINWHKK
jgi:hypothetical protein